MIKANVLRIKKYNVLVYCQQNFAFRNREIIASLNYTPNVLLTPPPSIPLYATQIINPFLNSRISGNYDKVNGLSANG